MPINQNVYRLSNGRYVLAHYSKADGRWYAPQTTAERKVTGCHTYYAGSLEGLGATSYASRQSAERRARQLDEAYD